MFRELYPLAWNYHRNTCRWPFNLHGINPKGAGITAFEENPSAPFLPLPKSEPVTTGLSELIAARASCRRFASEPLSQAQLGTVLRNSYGVLGESTGFGGFVERPVPSGGALYPLELYVLAQKVEGISAGVLHYVPPAHGLEVLHDEPLPRLLTAEVFLGQPYLANAAAIIVIAAVLERSLWKYEDRGYRYILLEAGHVAQNAILSAHGLGLSVLPLGGFFDDDLGGLLRLQPERAIVLYGIAIGVPDVIGRDERRVPPDGDERFRRY